MQRQMTEKELLKAISNPDHEKIIQLIPNLAEFSSAIKDFPQHNMKLYDRVLLAFNHSPEYKKQFTATFPEDMNAANEMLFHKIIIAANDLRTFEKKRPKKDNEPFSDIYELSKTAQKLNQNDAVALVEKVLSNKDEFKRLIREVDHARIIVTKYPQLENMISSAILKEPGEFERLVKNHHQLKVLTDNLPRHAEAFLNKILNDPVQFDRVISPFDLPLSGTFPEVPILNLYDMDEALAEVTKRAEKMSLKSGVKEDAEVHHVSMFNNNNAKEPQEKKRKESSDIDDRRKKDFPPIP